MCFRNCLLSYAQSAVMIISHPLTLHWSNRKKKTHHIGFIKTKNCSWKQIPKIREDPSPYLQLQAFIAITIHLIQNSVSISLSLFTQKNNHSSSQMTKLGHNTQRHIVITVVLETSALRTAEHLRKVKFDKHLSLCICLSGPRKEPLTSLKRPNLPVQ